uniref:(northern house mosquito) hypothetical protein n=1 Tax=Culex pipiens TaxID=7175 RepID=A0A8D8CVP1_CULPI
MVASSLKVQAVVRVDFRGQASARNETSQGRKKRRGRQIPYKLKVDRFCAEAHEHGDVRLQRSCSTVCGLQVDRATIIYTGDGERTRGSCTRLWELTRGLLDRDRVASETSHTVPIRVGCQLFAT